MPFREALSRARAALAPLRRAAVAAFAISISASATGAPSRIEIFYLGMKPAQPPASAVLDPPPTDTGLPGAQLAIADTNTTGHFTHQAFVLHATLAASGDDMLSDFRAALASGGRLFVLDAPADTLLKLADAPGAHAAVLLDATSADDRLRGADCRRNLLHMLPSRAMLADALMEYLVAKNWNSIMLLTGRDPGDAEYAEAIRRAADKFRISITADRSWTFNPAAQQADTGHFQVNDEVVRATQGASYDVLVVADEKAAFGNDLAYRTAQPRPVAGTQGLVPTGWAPVMDEYASTQLQLRFRDAVHRNMTAADYGGWLAVRAIGEAATRSGSADPAAIIAYLHGPDFSLAGYKGPELTFRPWDGQLRQPVLLADAHSIISVSPQPGFLHQNNELDSLGPDQPETACHFPR